MSACLRVSKMLHLLARFVQVPRTRHLRLEDLAHALHCLSLRRAARHIAGISRWDRISCSSLAEGTLILNECVTQIEDDRGAVGAASDVCLKLNEVDDSCSMPCSRQTF